MKDWDSWRPRLNAKQLWWELGIWTALVLVMFGSKYFEP